MHKIAFGMALVTVLAVCSVAAMGNDAPRGPRISESDNCFTMKQRVLSVVDDRAAVAANPGMHDRLVTNASGITARSDQARHDIVAGDSACEANDLAEAASYYQHAIDELTSPN